MAYNSMPENAKQFRPLNDVHSIESCTISLINKERINQKAYAQLPTYAAVSKAVGSLAFSRHPIRDLRKLALDEPQDQEFLYEFKDPSGAVQITVNPNRIDHRIQKYTRWENAKKSFDVLSRPIYNYFNNLVEINEVRLEYVDIYTWDGDWSDIDYQKIINTKSPLIALSASEFGAEWHSHCGWFEFLDDIRRLMKINIDAITMNNHVNSESVPALAVTTACVDSLATSAKTPSWGTFDHVIETLDAQHDALKNCLSRVICDSMSRRIGLNP